MTVLFDQRPRRRPAVTAISLDHVVDALKACSLQKAATFHSPHSPFEDVSTLTTVPRSLHRSITSAEALEALIILADEPQIIKEHKKAASHQSPSAPAQHAPLSPSLSTTIYRPGKSMSDFARQQLNKLLFQPILAQSTFEAFHPLLQDLAVAALAGRISSLRDAERKAIFLAPVSSWSEAELKQSLTNLQDFAPSAVEYRSFCETFIRHLQKTASSIHESNQCQAGDRPYTASYFTDLANHSRRYAAILAIDEGAQVPSTMSPALQVSPAHATSTSLDDTNTCRSRSSAHASTARTTRNTITSAKMTPARLRPDELEVSIPAKRTMNDSAPTDGPRRSMARRKAGAPILTYYCPEPTCRKAFTRPCDLTKHAKTHDRPAKCPEIDCKYHILGWPTDKECQRHWNDKHSPNPIVFRCLFDNCPYTSKRESNCKQHMEKSHKGFVYVRAKGNGKTKRAMPLTPSNLSTPATEPTEPKDESMLDHTPVSMDSPLLWTASAGSTDGAVQATAPSTGFEEGMLLDFGSDFNGHFNTFGFNPFQTVPITPAMSDECQLQFEADSSECFLDEVGRAIDADGSTAQTYALSQMPTPADSLFHQFQDEIVDGVDTFDRDFSYVQYGFEERVASTLSPHFSPYAQDLTLARDSLANNQDGFSDFATSAMENEDFQLFASGGAAVGADAMDPLFAESGLFAATDGIKSPSRVMAEPINDQTDIGHNTSSQSTNSQVFELFPDLGRPGQA